MAPAFAPYETASTDVMELQVKAMLIKIKQRLDKDNNVFFI